MQWDDEELNRREEKVCELLDGLNIKAPSDFLQSVLRESKVRELVESLNGQAPPDFLQGVLDKATQKTSSPRLSRRLGTPTDDLFKLVLERVKRLASEAAKNFTEGLRRLSAPMLTESQKNQCNLLGLEPDWSHLGDYWKRFHHNIKDRSFMGGNNLDTPSPVNPNSRVTWNNPEFNFKIIEGDLQASIIASATPSTAVPGKSTTAPEEKGVRGLHRKRNGPAQSVSRYDFFIAYASPDRQQAQHLSGFLQDESCAVFLDAECLAPGAPWPHALREALEASRVIVVLVSAHTDHAFYQQEEIVRAMQLARDKPGAYTVIPVILDKLPQGAVSMPYGTSSLQAPDATRPGGLKRVAAKLAAWLDAH
jgi:hypothetical protein